jgi:excisionase family DNA binding protein
MASAATRSKKKSKPNGRVSNREVLTLAEAAAYLRVARAEILQLAERHELPGRQIGKEWRFLKSALAGWLQQPDRKRRLLRHAGAIQNDPNLDEMLEKIYQERGRPMTENG